MPQFIRVQVYYFDFITFGKDYMGEDVKFYK